VNKSAFLSLSDNCYCAEQCESTVKSTYNASIHMLTLLSIDPIIICVFVDQLCSTGGGSVGPSARGLIGLGSTVRWWSS